MRYMGKKIGTLIITLFLISFLVFFAFELIPGDPAIAALGTEATPERLEALREQMGLNRPLIERYFEWAVNFIQGDFGTSYKYKIAVSEMIGDKLPITLIMSAIAFFIMVIVSLPLGIYTAKHNGTVIDRCLSLIHI